MMSAPELKNYTRDMRNQILMEEMLLATISQRSNLKQPPAPTPRGPHPFAHLIPMLGQERWGITRPLSQNFLFDLNLDREAIEALPNDQFMKAMMDLRADTPHLVQFFSPERISMLLGPRLPGIMELKHLPPEEWQRIHLAVILIKEQLSHKPFHANRAVKWGEHYWIDLQMHHPNW